MDCTTTLRMLVATLLLAGCAATSDIHDLTSSDAHYGQSADEQSLIQQAREFSEELQDKGLISRNQVCDDYIAALGARLVPVTASGVTQFRFLVVREPFVNAFALPDGTIYVTAGLLARLNNEAQLAFVLGHEISHVVLRHALKAHESNKNKIIAAHITDLVLMGTSIAYLPYVAAMASYSREQEEEADRMGLQLLSKAGYRVAEVETLFTMMSEVAATDSILGSIYGDHPSNAAREAAIHRLISDGTVNPNPDGTVGAQAYKAVRAPMIVETIELKLQIKEYQLALESAEAGLKLDATSSILFCYRGEALRGLGDDPESAAREDARIHDRSLTAALTEDFRKRHDAYYTQAEQAYRRALDLDAANARAFRGLGLIYFQQGKKTEARTALQHYLAVAGNAPDRRYIDHLLQEEHVP
jgi:beta-barrel assembly-enhancing protease